MSMIEGFGDEVTIFFAILLAFLVIAFAWISTNIRDIPFFSIFIIELSHGRRRASPARGENTEPVNETVQSSNQEHSSSSSSSSNEQTEELGVEINATDTGTLQSGGRKPSGEINCEENIEITQEKVVTHDSNSSVLDEDHNDTEEESITNQNEALTDHRSEADLTETELRHRRVNFFSKQKSEGLSEQRTSELIPEIQKLANVSNLSASSENDSQKTKSSLPAGSHGDGTSPQTSKPITNENALVNNSEKKENITNGSTDNDSVDTGDIHDSLGQQNAEAELTNEQITIRLKYLNDTQRNVTASLEDTIGQFRRANFAEELSENKLVRFIFNGQVLRNDSHTLQGYNIGDNSVIHCLVTQANLPNSMPRNDEDTGFDIGMLMLPVFGLIICFVWYLRFEYRQFFTATSTISLIGVTFLFIAAVLASWEGHRRGNRAHDHIE